MQQMEWRETLDDARAAKNVAALEQLDRELRAARRADLQEIGKLLDAGDFEKAAQLVRQLAAAFGRPARLLPLPVPALRAYQPLAPIRHRHLGAVPLGHLGGVGLDFMLACLAPYD